MMDLFKIPKLYFYRFLLWWFRPIYVWFFKLKAEGLENIPREGSFLLLANHSHKLDPFFIGAMIRRPIFQMASNEYFRVPIMRRFMWAMGAIPISKGIPNRMSLRNALKIIEKGYPFAVFPEGGRNWDGQTLPILDSTAKLIKHLKLPVITAVLKGNYIAWPRWANKPRKSQITLHFAKPIILDQKTPDEEINARIQRAIGNNDNYTEIERIKGRQPAEGLSRLLWRCPSCRALEGLVEENDNSLTCTSCGSEWEVSLHCQMRERGNGSWKPIKEYADLMVREEEIVPLAHERRAFLEENERVYLQSGEIALYHQPKYPKLKKVDDGRLYLTDKGLVFVKNGDGKHIRYRFDEMLGRSTEKNFIFQIVTKDKRIARFKMSNESCLKWEIYYDYVHILPLI
jgi:1-acyl-sn-glycerol-3-phosphate acyltransferase